MSIARARRTAALLPALLLGMAAPLAAEPPAHAPAHGYRAKHGAPPAPAREHHAGFEIEFDSERGVRVAVGFPGVFFSAGSFYRLHDGRWQRSARADGDWKRVAPHDVPEPIVKARGPKAPGAAAARH